MLLIELLMIIQKKLKASDSQDIDWDKTYFLVIKW